MISVKRRSFASVLCILLTWALTLGTLVAQEVSPPTPQQQETSPSRRPDFQEQEDKASQDILNRNHLPDGQGAAKSIEELPPAPETALRPFSQEPTGTAAAPAGRVTGTAASQPAGVAIAPSKQRQVRSILIKAGLLAGAGIALGTVYGLSKATPSTPPGSH